MKFKKYYNESRESRRDYFTYLKDAQAKLRNAGIDIPPFGWGKINIPHQELAQLLVQNGIAKESESQRFAAAMISASQEGADYDSDIFNFNKPPEERIALTPEAQALRKRARNL